ncbi:MAG: hypothetical protein ACE5H0_01290 [Bacteroidota bacterium]
MNRWLLVLILLFPIASPARGQTIVEGKLDQIIVRGIDRIYNLEFQEAERLFANVVDTMSNHPVGHFFLAMTDWWRILIDRENEALEKRFYQRLDHVIDLCDDRLDKNKTDYIGLLFKGGALGFRGRLRALKSQWIRAANTGKAAIDIVDYALKVYPENYDLLLGSGVYSYYADVIPDEYPLLKPFMLFLPKGDKQAGIEQLTLASQHARYASTEATYFLFQLYFHYEKQYLKSLELAHTLHEKYPRNALFHRYVGRCYAVLNRWEEVKAVFDDVLARYLVHQPGYSNFVGREAYYYLGAYSMSRGQDSLALAHFFRCDELSRKLDREGASGFMVMANLKIGMIYDTQGKRELAIQQYRKVLAMKDYNKAHKSAKLYLKTPYGQF